MKSNRIRLVAFFIFVFLFAGLFVWWMFHLPYNENSLYRTIPHNADMVSCHLDLPARLMLHATNDAATQILPAPILELRKAIPASGGLIKALSSSELKGKRSVIAYIHRSGHRNKPAWYFTIWLGAYGQTLRWSLLFKTPPELIRMGTDSGYPMWATKTAVANEPVLSIALVDGMLIGCISTDPAGVRDALETYDGHVPSVMTAKLPDYVAPLIPNPEAPDKGWFRMPTRPVPGMPHLVAFSFDSIESPCIRGAFQSDMPLATNSPLHSPANIDGLRDRFGIAPSAVLVLPGDFLTTTLEAAPHSLPIAVASMLLQSGAISPSNSPVVAAIFLGEFGGRIQLPLGRPRIPALSLAMRLGDRERVRGAFTQAADLVNAVYRTGLIVSPAQVLPDGTPFYGLEMTASNSVLMLSSEDMPACALVDDWFVLSSHAQSLKSVLSQYPAASATNAPAPSKPPEWQRRMQEQPTSAYLWVDLDATGKELETLLTFAQMAAGMKKGSDFADAIVLSRKLIKQARPFKTCHAWVEIPNNRPRLCVEIGAAGASGVSNQ